MMRILKNRDTRDKRDGDRQYGAAMSLLEAFSAVDEKYLVVCGTQGDACLTAGSEKDTGRLQVFLRGGKAAAALFAVLAGITVTAAVYQRWDERLVRYFNSPSEEMQNKTLAEGIAGMQQASAKDRDITVSVVQTVHDEKRICMLLEVDAPEAALSDDFWFSRIELLTEDGRDVNWGVGEMQIRTQEMSPAEPGTRKWSYYIDIRREVPLTMGSLILRLTGCEAITPRGQVKIDGEWELPLQLTDVSGLTRRYQREGEIMLKDGRSAHVKEVCLTPMTVRIIYEEDNLRVDNAYTPSAILDQEGNILSEVGDRGVSSDGVANGQLKSVLDVEQAYAVRIGEDSVVLLRAE